MKGFTLNSMYIPEDLCDWLRENARLNKGHIGSTVVQKLREMKQVEHQLKEIRSALVANASGASYSFAGTTQDLEKLTLEREASLDMETTISLEDMERHFEN